MRTPGLVVLIATSSLLLAASWETPGTFKAGRVLPPELLKGEHHEVRGEVGVESHYYTFDLHTRFGTLKPWGLDLLRKRVRENEALAALEEVSHTRVFLEAAGRSLQTKGEAILSIARDPEGTAEGLGSAFKRAGVNLGRRTKRTVEDVRDDEEGDGEDRSTTEKVEGVANAALGVNRAARVWAEKLQVDPYSRNPIVQKALLEVARIDAAGRIATDVAVPIPTVVSGTAQLGKLVWGKDPEALRKSNEAALEALGVSDEVAKRFLRSEVFTPTEQTRFVTALAEVKAKGLDDYVDAALGATTARQALFFVEGAEMLRRQHGESPVSAVLTDSQALVALSGGRAVALLPLDDLAWTEQGAGTLTEITERSKKELGAKGLQVQLTGRVSDRARTELQGLGWAVQDRVSGGSPSGNYLGDCRDSLTRFG